MDVLARLYAEKLSAALGKPVVVENKPGAATMLAANYVANAPADGHTLVVLTSSALAINQHLYKQINYNPEADFTPISLYVKSPLILVVNPNIPAKDVKEFIAHAKQRKPPMDYVSVGAGGFQHISMEFAKQRFGFDANHVPYRNTGQSVVDLIAGHVQTGFVEAGASIPTIKDGKLRALAVSSVDPASAAAGRAAVRRSGRCAGLRGGVLARPDGAREDAETGGRPAARRDAEDHGRSGDEEARRRHRADPVQFTLGRRHQRLHQVGAGEVGHAGREDRAEGHAVIRKWRDVFRTRSRS